MAKSKQKQQKKARKEAEDSSANKSDEVLR